MRNSQFKGDQLVRKLMVLTIDKHNSIEKGDMKNNMTFSTVSSSDNKKLLKFQSNFKLVCSDYLKF